MDDILSAIARLLGRLIGRNMECGLDCTISDLEWAEYLLLVVIFLGAFVVTLKVIHYFRNKDN